MLTVRSIINFASQTVPPIIPVVQGDPGRAILFTLADFTIPAGATATYYVQKPSGEAVYNNATIDGNNVLVELTPQSIIEKGDNYGQVRIAVGEDIVTSFDFILLVKEFRGIDAVQSLTEMNIFDKAVEQAAEEIDEVKTDALEAIDDAKDEAIEEVTSNFDLQLNATSIKGVQNQVITQAINTVNNAIGDLSGETVTPTATNNYGVGGNVGQVIETWATTEYWHGIYTVSAGNTYGITTVSDFPQQLVVWFTNASNTIIENHKAFATDHVEMVCTAPTGATKLFVMSYGYDAYHGTVQKVEPLSETVSNLKDDLTTVESDVTDLKDGFNDFETDLINLCSGKQTISGAFSYGIFNSSNMPETDPRKFNAVMMTAETYNRDITLTAKDGYNFLAYFYDENDNYVSKGTRWESSRYVPKNTYFRLWVRQNPLDTSIVLNLDTVKHQILFNVPIQDEIDDTAKSVALANANADLSGAGLQMIDTLFAYGTMNTQTGQAVSDTAYKYQVIMPNYATYDRDVTIKCNNGYRYQVWWYNEDDTYISRTGSFKTDADEYTVTSGTHFRLFVTLNPPQSGTVVPIETFASNVFIKTQIGDRVTAVETKPLSTLPEYVLNTLSYKQVGVLSKGYILLSCDDGTEGLATYTIPMLINKNVPATFGLLMTSPVITNESYLSTVLDAVENHGCCVAQHGSVQWTTYTEDALNKYFDDTETLFTEKGITEIYGAICPGGASADTNKLVKAVAGGRFGAVFSGGLQDELKYGNYNAVGARTNMYAMARYSAIAFTQQTYQQAIDDAYDNHYILCPFWHDYSVVDDTAKQAIIEGMIDYAKTKGLTFITMADLPYVI